MTDNNKIQANLTEQWKKGELPSGWYYVQLQEGVYADNVKSIIMDYYTEFCDFMKHPYLIEKVLAPVPSYEEWKALNGNMDSVMQTNKALCKKLAQLKDLLNEWASFDAEENPKDFTVMSERMSELANKTKEVLK